MQVPMLDLKGQYAKIRKEVMKEVGEVLDSQWCIGGPKVSELEEKIATYSDCKYAVGVSSGSDAILNSLMSLDIGPGDDVITTPFTFFATAGCIARTGAKPVFVDIDPVSFNINHALIEAVVTERTRAILPVHLYGQMADMDAIMAVAGRNGLAVIEDACQSIGAVYKGKKCGSIGTTGCFSFYPTKNLGGMGDGGMIVTNDEQLYERMKIMRDHGQKPRYYYHHVGGNFRLDAIQAAALLVKLPHLEKWSQGRQKNAAYYDKKFKDANLVTPVINEDCVSVFNQYVIRVKRRDELVEHLQERGVGSVVYYPLGLHVQECFRYLGYKDGDFPETEKAAREVLALPIYPELTREMLDAVVEAVLSFVS